VHTRKGKQTVTTNPAAPIVAGIDGSPPSLRALAWATREAAVRQRPLRIVHAFLWPLTYDLMGPPGLGTSDAGLGVVAVHAYQLPTLAAAADPRLVIYDVDGWRQHQTRLLTDALAGYADKYADVPVHQKVVNGASADVLVAESAGAALTVVGSRGRGGFTGLLLGSTSQSLLHHATGPVAIVRAHPSQHGGATKRPRRH
jgi:nucleotide-binding universal stress UspA family protein